MALYVGTSGWSYPGWKPAFYPQGLPQSRWLEHYSKVLTACEINATFYRLQADSTLSKWARATSPSFRFATKAHRSLTHGREIAPHRDRSRMLEAFCKSVSSLGGRLGAMLFQFPPYRRRDDDGLAHLLKALPAGTPTAFEFRHVSWESPDVQPRIAEAGGTVCISDTAGSVPAGLPPGPIGYVRLRLERYSPAARCAWLELLQAEASSRDVFVFAKHEEIAVGDEYGGLGLARWIVEHA
jgi:uncharacterized protein YecE (DUF72 family)